MRPRLASGQLVGDKENDGITITADVLHVERFESIADQDVIGVCRFFGRELEALVEVEEVANEPKDRQLDLDPV